MISLIFNSTYFQFDGKFYKQIFGLPMGSPLSPILSDMVVQDLENEILSSLKFQIPVYYRYVDDLLLAVPKKKIQWLVTKFNSYNENSH